MATTEFKVSDITFFSNFDSANLGRVELNERNKRKNVMAHEEAVEADKDPENRKDSGDFLKNDAPSADLIDTADHSSKDHDYDFNLWTRPDCAGTEFENGNRTWFFFGVTKTQYTPGVDKKSYVLRLTFRNLNKQSKLFSQGMLPIFTTAGNRTESCINPAMKWERIKDSRPVFGSQDSHFVLSFRLRIDPRQITYVAFTYPYTYRECQNYLAKLEKKYDTNHLAIEGVKARPIYFRRELLCYSYEKKRVDLLTVTAPNGILLEREERISDLFPTEHEERPYKFSSSKKVVFVSARVHPGETQSSFVINGFLKFLLRETDPRAIALRKRYVFKLVPMLNPDGVYRGHYRTDVRGVNLNRVYTKPSLIHHPSIFAVSKLIVYAHEGKIEEDSIEETAAESSGQGITAPSCNPVVDEDANNISGSDQESVVSAEGFRTLRSSIRRVNTDPLASPGTSGRNVNSANYHPWYEMTDTSRCSEGDESIADFSHGGPGGLIGLASSGARVLQDRLFADNPQPPRISNITSNNQQPNPRTSFSGVFSSPGSGGVYRQPSPVAAHRRRTVSSSSSNADARFTIPSVPSQQDVLGGMVSGHQQKPTFDTASSQNQIDKRFDFSAKYLTTLEEDKAKKVVKKKKFDPSKSGLFAYIDIHGHASKKGCFIYGNHFRDMTSKVEAMLLPKLMSLNCANFDFPACTFTEKNMYLKDRHTGAGKEGSGRVSVFKATGLIYSYTLECNFNTGRIVNPVPTPNPSASGCGRITPPITTEGLPPVYDPLIYEDVGKAMAVSILDLTESNPWSRISASSCKNLKGVREEIRKFIRQNDERQRLKSTEKQSKGGDGTPKKKNSRRSRTISTNSLKSSPILSAKVKPGSSNETYRPNTKRPRKNSTVARNLTHQLSQTSILSGFSSTSIEVAGGQNNPLESLQVEKKKKKSSKSKVIRSRSQTTSRSSSPVRRKPSLTGGDNQPKKSQKKRPVSAAAALTSRTSTSKNKKLPSSIGSGKTSTSSSAAAINKKSAVKPSAISLNKDDLAVIATDVTAAVTKSRKSSLGGASVSTSGSGKHSKRGEVKKTMKKKSKRKSSISKGNTAKLKPSTVQSLSFDESANL